MALPHDIKIPEEIRQLHAKSSVIDLHGDSFLWAKIFGYDIGKRHKNRFPYVAPLGRHIDLPRMRDVGMDGQIFGVVVNPKLSLEKRKQAAIEMIERVRAGIEANPDKIGLAKDYSDYQTLRKKGLMAGMIGIEGAHCLGGEVDQLKRMKALGAVYISFAHLTANEACRPNRDIEHTREGLSSFGFELIEAVEEQSIIFDMAHINEKGMFDILENRQKKEQPIIVSHTGIKGVYDHWRNLTDKQIKAIADTDGVIGIMYQSNFLTNSIFSEIDIIIEHYRYVKKLVGARHLALGSDFDGGVIPPRPIRGIEDLALLTAKFLEAGFTEEEVIGILGENFLRVFKKVLG